VAEASRPGIVLDTGALLAVESGDLSDVLAEAYASKLPIRLSGGAVAQASRGGPRSARLAALLKQDVHVVALDAREGRRVGELIARTMGRKRKARPDVVDAHTALLARETQSLVYTSDPDDIGRYGVALERIRRV
jgi:predicted nucleic acid-binding protein